MVPPPPPTLKRNTACFLDGCNDDEGTFELRCPLESSNKRRKKTTSSTSSKTDESKPELTETSEELSVVTSDSSLPEPIPLPPSLTSQWWMKNISPSTGGNLFDDDVDEEEEQHMALLTKR